MSKLITWVNIESFRKATVQDIRDALAAGLDINACDDAGLTPLMKACLVSGLDVVQEIISAGPDLEILDKDLATALSYAVMSGRLDVVRAVVDAKANINHEDIHGWTSLRGAVNDQKHEIARFLLQRGAITGVKCIKNEETEIFTAIHNNDEEMINILLEFKIALDIQNRDGETIFDIVKHKKKILDILKKYRDSENNIAKQL